MYNEISEVLKKKDSSLRRLPVRNLERNRERGRERERENTLLNEQNVRSGNGLHPEKIMVSNNSQMSLGQYIFTYIYI